MSSSTSGRTGRAYTGYLERYRLMPDRLPMRGDRADGGPGHTGFRQHRDRRLGVAEIEVPERVERAADVEVFHVRPHVAERLRQAAKGLGQAVPRSDEVVRELKVFKALGRTGCRYLLVASPP